MNLSPEEFRKQWIAALRSGEYKQGKDALHYVQKNEFCCLGVACDLYIKNGGELQTVEREDIMLYDHAAGSLPHKVQKALGIASAGGTYNPEVGKSSTLADDNDRGLPFTVIADIIESAPRGLFIEEIIVENSSNCS